MQLLIKNVLFTAGGTRQESEENVGEGSPEKDQESDGQPSPEVLSLLGLNWLFEHTDSDTENSKQAASQSSFYYIK